MRIRYIAAAVVLATGLALGTTATAAMAHVSGPRLTVSPPTGLHNHEVVKVRGSGFKKGDTIYLTECLITAKGEAGCDIFTATPVTVSSTGTIPVTRFRVVTGAIGSGHCGTTRANLHACAISAGNAQGKDTGSAHIAFALPHAA